MHTPPSCHPAGRPIGRRGFLASLAALLAVPLLPRAATLAASEPTDAGLTPALFHGILDEAVTCRASEIHLRLATPRSTASVLDVRFAVGDRMIPAPKTVPRVVRTAFFAALGADLRRREQASRHGVEIGVDDYRVYTVRTARGNRVRVRLTIADDGEVPGYVICKVQDDPSARHGHSFPLVG